MSSIFIFCHFTGKIEGKIEDGEVNLTRVLTKDCLSLQGTKERKGGLMKREGNTLKPDPG